MPVMPGYTHADTPHPATIQPAGYRYGCSSASTGDTSPRGGQTLYLAPGAQPAPSISPVALRHVIQWLRNGCDPMKAADELEMIAAAPEAKP